MRSPGFELGIASLEDLHLGNIDWEAFKDWLIKNGTTERWTRYLANYAKPFQECLVTKDLGKLRDLPETLRPNAIKCLAALSKYLGVYEEFKMLLRNYGLKWVGKSSTDIVIDRLTKVEDSGEVFEWIRQVKRARPELSDLMDLMATTGMRYEEAIDSYNLIIQLTRKRKLADYYNPKKGNLEHFRFKDIFIRHNKKVFISFASKEMVERIAENQPLPSMDSDQKLVQKKGLKLRFSNIREAHGTFMTKHLQQPEIDFLHGRVSSNVFMKNYFNPALIGDLKIRAFQGIKEIQRKIA